MSSVLGFLFVASLAIALSGYVGAWIGGAL
jgi:hypothetical protein